MLIAYSSLTGNIKRFVSKLPKEFKVVELDPDMDIQEPYILVTYTIGFGEVPDEVEEFLEYNHKKMVGVSGSGNRIWGDNYTKAVETISEKYHVPIVGRFELSGTQKDIDLFTQEVMKLDKQYSKLD